MFTQSSSTEPLHSHHSTPRPLLFVDLDGTLILGDSLWECFAMLVRQHPIAALISLFSLLKGRAVFKQTVARQVDFSPDVFRYNDEVVNFVCHEVEQGVPVVLATAADKIIGTAVASHLGCFSHVIASDGRHNFKGSDKLSAINEYINNTTGARTFGYIGDSRADRSIWVAADKVIVAASSAKAAQNVAGRTHVDLILPKPQKSWIDFFKALRIHQWIKNSLVFIPLLLSHQYTEADKLSTAILGFICYGLCASATYLWNDILDLPADRRHPRKQYRPLAAGKISIEESLVTSCFLLVLSFSITHLFLPPMAAAMLCGYIVLTVTYSLFLKEKLLLDTMMLGMLYAYRILFGGIATGIAVSDWLIAFSLFFFLGLALVKRYSEIAATSAQQPSQKIGGRGYYTGDREVIGILGVAASYLSILILALYITSPVVVELYNTPQALWGVCFVMIYWISRIWVLCHRGHMPDDPIVFALRDKVSLFSGLVCLLSVLIAKF